DTIMYAVTVSDAYCAYHFDSISITVIHPPSHSLSYSDFAICEGDSVLLSTTTGNYSYQWSTGSSGNSIFASNGGYYYCLLTDTFGCIASTDTFYLTEYPPAQPVILSSAPNGLCSGDTIQLYINQTFLDAVWNTGEFGDTIQITSGGTYSVTTFLGNNCNANTSVFIQEYLPAGNLEIMASDSSICPGETTSLIPSPGYNQFIWNTGATTDTLQIQSGGLYILNASNPCGADIDSIIIQQLLAPSPAITVDRTPIFCDGDSVRLICQDGFSSYQWSTGQTTSSILVYDSGQYSVTVTNQAGCTGTSPLFTVTEHPAPPIPTITVSGNLLSTNSPAISYQWYLNGAPINRASSNTYTALISGTYTVQITDSNGCKVMSLPVIITSTDNSLTSAFRIYPNPTQGFFWIESEYSAENWVITCYDLTGRFITSQTWNGGMEIRREVEFNNLPSGLYILQIRADERVANVKIEIVR
ncbi:MAG: T9SS type A sorting domain-containing protein, partial [Bacteroidia bacterium]|nr:T9SS type A sorting domain-containing protein [Bacteroidia bacterium]